MNYKELTIYLARYSAYKKDNQDSVEYFNARQYHEYNNVPYAIFSIIETLYDYNNDTDKIIEVLKIYGLWEE